MQSDHAQKSPRDLCNLSSLKCLATQTGKQRRRKRWDTWVMYTPAHGQEGQAMYVTPSHTHSCKYTPCSKSTQGSRGSQHIMQENPSAAGAPPRTQLTGLPDPLPGGDGLASLLKTQPLSALPALPFMSPTPKISSDAAVRHSSSRYLNHTQMIATERHTRETNR